jgi:hypothetical protein
VTDSSVLRPPFLSSALQSIVDEEEKNTPTRPSIISDRVTCSATFSDAYRVTNSLYFSSEARLTDDITTLLDRFNAGKQTKYGVMWKRGQGLIVNPWSKRYFILDYHKRELTYYTTEKVRELRGKVSLRKKRIKFHQRGGHSWDKKGWGIEIIYEAAVSGTSRMNMFLVAKTEKEARSWAEALTTVSAIATPRAAFDPHDPNEFEQAGEEIRESIALYRGIIHVDAPLIAPSTLPSSSSSSSSSSSVPPTTAAERLLISPVVVDPARSDETAVQINQRGSRASRIQGVWHQLEKTLTASSLRLHSFDAIFISLATVLPNMVRQLRVHGRLSLLPLVPLLLPSQYQIYGCILLMYVLIYSDMPLRVAGEDDA